VLKKAFVKHFMMTGAFNTLHENRLLSLIFSPCPGRDKERGSRLMKIIFAKACKMDRYTAKLRPRRPFGGSIAWLFALLIAIVGPSGCRSGRAASEAPVNFLRVDIDTSPLSLDPRYGTDAVSSRINELIFESLARVDEHGVINGELAESIERPSPAELVFHLRSGIRFSDGRALTARDVKYTYDSVLAPAAASPKRGDMGALKAVEAPDASTVKFITSRPYAAAMQWALLGVVPYGTQPARDNEAWPRGSGPFRLGKLVRDQWVVLDRNPYRRADPSAIAGVAFKVVPDPTVCALELIRGNAQFAQNNLPPGLAAYLRGRRGLEIVQAPGSTYQYMEFNFRDPILADLRVRRAIAMAIDRNAIVSGIMRGTARVASGMLSPENWAYEPNVAHYTYDPQAASRLLDSAGYSIGPDGTRFTLVYTTTQGEERRLLAEAFAAMLARVGIGLRIKTFEWPTFYNDIQRGNFDVTSMAWIGISDPHHYYMVFDSAMTPPRGLNRSGYSNPRMDRLLRQAETAWDPAQRKAIYSEVQKLAAHDLAYISLWWQNNVAVMSRDVNGFRPFPNGSLRSFDDISLKSSALPVASVHDPTCAARAEPAAQ
jgi:peptide/nickel transport system substrate-binding protein